MKEFLIQLCTDDFNTYRVTAESERQAVELLNRGKVILVRQYKESNRQSGIIDSLDPLLAERVIDLESLARKTNLQIDSFVEKIWDAIFDHAGISVESNQKQQH